MLKYFIQHKTTKDLLIVLATWILIISPLLAQGDLREEIQRYFGYETLLARYLTILYDVFLGTYIHENYTDSGFIPMLLPILLLIKFRDNSTLFWIIFLGMFVSLGLYINYSNLESMDYFTQKPLAWLRHSFNDTLFRPLSKLVTTVSGEQDAITYPIILTIWLAILYFIRRSKSILLFALVYCSFLWVLVGSGIIWYSYLMLVLAIVVTIMYLIESYQFSKEIGIGISVIAAIWVLSATINRMSNITFSVPEEVRGRFVLDETALRYSAGKFSRSHLHNLMTNGANEALDEMNSSDANIYRVGTAFSYFIKNNHLRVYSDNQLSMGWTLIQEYKTAEKINGVFKAMKVEYIILDLLTPNIDNTPEKSLSKKYYYFFKYCELNPNMQLMATDRIFVDSQGNQTHVLRGEKVVNYGTYAIFKIL